MKKFTLIIALLLIFIFFVGCGDSYKEIAITENDFTITWEIKEFVETNVNIQNGGVISENVKELQVSITSKGYFTNFVFNIEILLDNQKWHMAKSDIKFGANSVSGINSLQRPKTYLVKINLYKENSMANVSYNSINDCRLSNLNGTVSVNKKTNQYRTVN